MECERDRQTDRNEPALFIISRNSFKFFSVHYLSLPTMTLVSILLVSCLSQHHCPRSLNWLSFIVAVAAMHHDWSLYWNWWSFREVIAKECYWSFNWWLYFLMDLDSNRLVGDWKERKIYIAVYFAEFLLTELSKPKDYRLCFHRQRLCFVRSMMIYVCNVRIAMEKIYIDPTNQKFSQRKRKPRRWRNKNILKANVGRALLIRSISCAILIVA